MADLKIKPIGKRILVRPQKEEEQTKGKLILPPSAMEDKKPEVGEVLALGTGSNDKDFQFHVKVGDKVFFKKYAPDEIEVDGEKYFVIDVDDILAVIA